jgi:transposase
MANSETYTTKQAAKELGVSIGTFRKKAKTVGLEPVGKIETGKRGRPSSQWSKSQLSKLAK